MWACVISSVVMGIAAAIVNYFILLPLFETFMPLDQLIASFGEMCIRDRYMCLPMT